MRGLTGRNVLITGGGRGIGRATATRFIAEGSRVVICDSEPSLLETAVAELSESGFIKGVECDVSRQAEVERMVHAAEEALGGIDVLINNAGIAREEPFLEIAAKDWDRVVEVNLRGVFLVAQTVARRMVDRGVHGVIINMSSTNGLVGEEGYAHYNASKGGVLLLTKTMALELGRFGIRVNALCPGYIQTPMSEAIDDAEFVAAYVRDKIPIGRVGRPEDVAAAYAFLASDDASFIHGEALVIDGGQLTQ